jgi:protease-4
MTGQGGAAPTPFGGGAQVRSDDVEKAFQAAIDDSSVKAIVFRVSSPGGSDTASEQILAAVRAAKAAGKPVVVSMGTYAASGGYWISSQASRIVAEPTTLTGSIGVFGGKFALGEALSKFGVEMRGLKVGGDYADAFAGREPMSATQRAAFSAWMDTIYDGFIRRVAQGRSIPEARVREIARGRVWTGAQAKALGLVDRLGGFYEAVDEAKALAGIQGEARLRSFDASNSPLDSLKRLLGVSTQAASLLSALGAAANAPEARALEGQVSDGELRARGATVLAPRWVN